MKKSEYIKCKLHGIEYRNHSTMGNPSYWVNFTDDEGNFHRGYTGSNSSSGYTIKNYRYADNGQTIWMKYHFTKNSNCIIDCIKDNSPDRVTE